MALFGTEQLTMERAWLLFLFNVKMCAGRDKNRR